MICIFELLKPKHLLINDRLDVVRVNRSVHSLELLSAPYKHSSDGTHVAQAIQETRLVFREATQEAYDGDDAFGLDCLQALLHRCRPADFQNVVDPGAMWSKLLSRSTPFRIALVVEDMVGTQLFECLRFRVRAGSGDYASPGCFGKLERPVSASIFA